MVKLESIPFNCKECGERFLLHPPDAVYTHLNTQKRINAVKRTYPCRHHHENVIYWLTSSSLTSLNGLTRNSLKAGKELPQNE